MPAASNAETAGATPPDPGSVRARGVVRIVFILFCLEVGLILLLLPWTLLWDNNFFLTLSPAWSRFWLNSYVRGAVSGLGAVNLWIAAVEARRMLR